MISHSVVGFTEFVLESKIKRDCISSMLNLIMSSEMVCTEAELNLVSCNAVYVFK